MLPLSVPTKDPATIANLFFDEMDSGNTDKDWDQVRQWVRACPEMVKKKQIGDVEFYSRFPLHVACIRNAPLDVIKLLVEQWPGAVMFKDKFGVLPLRPIMRAR